MARSTRVLLVDSFQDEREMYEEYLDFTGFEPLHCEPAQAFEVATISRPDVIVTDFIFQRGLDGLELIRNLKSDERTARAIVVVISGMVFPWHREQVYAAGCNVFLPKPCLPQTLVETIRRELPSPPHRKAG